MPVNQYFMLFLLKKVQIMLFIPFFDQNIAILCSSRIINISKNCKKRPNYAGHNPPSPKMGSEVCHVITGAGPKFLFCFCHAYSIFFFFLPSGYRGISGKKWESLIINARRVFLRSLFVGAVVVVAVLAMGVALVLA